VTDITRTWPISRKFTDPQRDLYQVSYLSWWERLMVGGIECTERMCENVYRRKKYDFGHHTSGECGYSQSRTSEFRLRSGISGFPLL
jgi:hypothetical protein